MIDFYPTPESLASKLLDTFKKRIDYESLVLEPEAGRGDLIAPLLCRHRNISIECVEIEPNNVEILRAKNNVSVVGYDFLEFEARKLYSHIVMNPPFSEGAAHVLKAWDVLIDGELVALVNAETLKNPCDKKRKLLTQIIEDNGGEVEYLKGAFRSPDTQRKTNVECAIIHLTKKADFTDLYIAGLKTEIFETPKIDQIATGQQLAMRESTIVQAVKIFNAAANALKDEETMTAQLANQRAYYANLLADSMIRTKKENTHSGLSTRYSNSDIAKAFNENYQELKERAWSHVLTATKLTNGLSSKVRESLHNNFKDIAKLEFSEANIHGFLASLFEAKQKANAQMMLDCFDWVTQYHTGNRQYYRGWKSNDKHMKNAYRIGMTRFILPLGSSWYSSGLGHEGEQKLRDFDLAFATLDGTDINKVVGLYDVFRNHYDELAGGERLSSKYFEVRYYPGAGTVHFFPKDKTLIDRLNRLVGRERAWLPPEGEKVSEEFWLQYDAAEKITAKLDARVINNVRWNGDEGEAELLDSIKQVISDLKLKPKNTLQKITPGTKKKRAPATPPVEQLDIQQIQDKYASFLANP